MSEPNPTEIHRENFSDSRKHVDVRAYGKYKKIRNKDAKPAGVALWEKRWQYLDLRKQGLSYYQIAQRFGVSETAVSHTVKGALAELIEISKEDAEEVRQLELERLDEMLQGIWNRATTGDVAAVDRVVKLMERRAKYSGLDAPTRGEITGKDGGPIEITDPRELLIGKLAELASKQPAVRDPGVDAGEPSPGPTGKLEVLGEAEADSS